MRAVGYLRELAEPTLEVQQRALLDFCSAAGLEVGATFTDTPAERGAPEFHRMLRLLEADGRGFTVVAVASLAVFGSRARDQARRYLQLAALGLPLRIAAGAGGDPDEALLRAWRSRRPDERRRERVREAMRGRALRGEVLGRPPYGYRVDSRRLRPHDEEALVVREIFRACQDENEGVRRIARRLNDAGLRTRRGGPWSMVSVRDILRNPVYTGTYRRLGVVVPGAHEPLVPRQQFDRVQRLLAERRTSPGRQRRHRYLLSGLARCAYCGNRLIGVRRARGAGGGEHVYYQCESRTNHGRCDYHTRRADELEEAVRRRVVAKPRSGDRVASVPPDAGDARRRAGRRARERTLDRMIERRASGEWTARRLRSESASLVLEDLAEERAASAGVEDDGAHGRGRGSADAARALLAERWDGAGFDERRDLLRRAVASVIVSDDDVQVQFVA